MARHVCPGCRREFEVDTAARASLPFCSKRCRWVDLARWMNEEYAISRPMTEDESASAAWREWGAVEGD